MLEQIWTRFLELTAQFVTPDWGKLIGLHAGRASRSSSSLVLIWIFRSLRRAPRRPAAASSGSRRRTPAGIHMPGPSFAPVFAAVGVVPALARPRVRRGRSSSSARSPWS